MWGMPGHTEAMKAVVSCDKPGEWHTRSDPGWPNGATRLGRESVITRFERERTQGTETSQYLEEEKSTEMPGVAASETGPSPNRSPCGTGVVGPTGRWQRQSGEVPWNGAPETVRAR